MITTVPDASLSLADFRQIAAIMHQEARISLSMAKVTLVQSRLARRLRSRELADFREYVALVQSCAAERAAMVTALTTNHTSFFREVHHFDHLRATLMPKLRLQAEAGSPVRIWSAGCSSGEEIYSAAMCLLGTDPTARSWARSGNVRLLATDIAAPMAEATRRGRYPHAAADSIPLPYRAAWVREDRDQVVVADEVRAMVTARVLNLFADWPMRHQYDAIFCRNVMIYFDDASKEELEQRLVDQLAPGGTLYLGHSERLTGAAASAARLCGQTTYVKEGLRA